MARRTRRKYYKRKGRWSANIKNVTLSQTINTSGSFYLSQDLCTNPAQVESTVSQQYTIKNVSYCYKIFSNNTTSVVNLQTYIMFVPQGYTISESLPFTHPEWIMASRFLGGPDEVQTNDRNPQVIRTRLARRLQTGDKIIFLILGENAASTASIYIHGLLKWFTKAN